MESKPRENLLDIELILGDAGYPPSSRALVLVYTSAGWKADS
jgi:hypothetical protein